MLFEFPSFPFVAFAFFLSPHFLIKKAAKGCLEKIRYEGIEDVYSTVRKGIGDKDLLTCFLIARSLELGARLEAASMFSFGDMLHARTALPTTVSR